MTEPTPTPTPTPQRRPFGRLRAGRIVHIIVGVVIFLVVYIGSHIVLSRWSYRVLLHYDNTGFFYVPATPETLNANPWMKKVADALAVFYWPAWQIDHHFFDGPTPDSTDYIDETLD